MASDPALRSWVPVPAGSDFPIQNLPYGVFSARGKASQIGVAIGDHILDLSACSDAGLFTGVADREILQARNLNGVLAAGQALWRPLRARAIELLRADTNAFQAHNRERFLVKRTEVSMLLPFTPGDYVDFYSSREHATNLGKILRPNSEPLLPNWSWLPIGYHGRSGTIVIDGTPIVRPCGQMKPADAAAPVFGPTRQLDIELEVGFITGPGNALGTTIPAGDAQRHIFGLVLVNDWSARDIQAWEYQPLGPFLGKSFATSLSPWIVTLEALEAFAVQAPPQDPPALPHLHDPQRRAYDVDLSIGLQTAGMRAQGLHEDIIARTNFRSVYWSMAQQLAHVTSNGAVIRPGDLFASGTVSGTTADSYGSLIELTWRGARPLHLSSGESRGFLQDGDCVTLRGWCEKDGVRIGFGEVRGTIEAARA